MMNEKFVSECDRSLHHHFQREKFNRSSYCSSLFALKNGFRLKVPWPKHGLSSRPSGGSSARLTPSSSSYGRVINVCSGLTCQSLPATTTMDSINADSIGSEMRGALGGLQAQGTGDRLKCVHPCHLGRDSQIVYFLTLALCLTCILCYIVSGSYYSNSNSQYTNSNANSNTVMFEYNINIRLGRK